MRNLKKVLSLALALVMLLGMMVMGASAAKFADVPDGDAKQEAVDVMNAINIIKGDESGFRPNDTLTRAEAAVIISKVLMTPSVMEKFVKDNSNVTSKFADVNAYQGGWAAPYVEACVASQVIKGDDDGNFAPAREVSGVEFAAMLLRTLDIDKGQFVNWPFDWQRAALNAGLDEGADVFAEKLTRADAAQMAFNALNYSAEGTVTEYTVTAKKTGQADKNLYTGTSEVSAYLVATQAKDDVSAAYTDVIVTKSTTAVGSLGENMYGLVKNSGTDAFKRPTVVWNSTKDDSLEVEVSATAARTWEGTVSNKTIYNAAGKAAQSYTWKVYEDGVVDESKTAASAFNNNNNFAGAGRGSVTYLYVDAEKKEVVVSSVNIYVGTVARVVEARGNAKRYVSLANSKGTFTTEDFAVNDVVLYTQTISGSTKTIRSMDYAPELAGYLNKIVIKGGSYTFTLDGHDYVTSKTAEDGLNDGLDAKGGQDVTFYTDTQGNIIMLKGIGAAATDYFYVVANSASYENTNYITNGSYPWCYKAYGVLSDGTVVEKEVLAMGDDTDPDNNKVGSGVLKNADASNSASLSSNRSINGKYLGLFIIKDEIGGALILSAKQNTATSAVIEVNKPGITYATTRTGVATSKTTFFFVEQANSTASDRTITNVEVKTGIANIGSNIASGGAVVGAKGNSVETVFVNRGYYDDSISPEIAGVVYVIAGTQKTVKLYEDGKATTAHSYEAYDIDGVKGTYFTTDLVTNFDGKVCEINEDNFLLGTSGRAWAEAVVTYMDDTSIKLDNVDHAFNNLPETSVVSASRGGLTELSVGDKVIMVGKAAYDTGVYSWDAMVVYVTGAGTTEVTNEVKEVKNASGVVTGYDVTIPVGVATSINMGDITPAADADPANTVQISLNGGANKWTVRFDGAADNPGTRVWNNSHVNPEDVLAFRFPVSTGHDYLLYITSEGGVDGDAWIGGMEVTVPTTATSTGMLIVNVVNTKDAEGTVYNEAAVGTLGGVTLRGSLRGTGAPLTAGTYIWKVVEITHSATNLNSAKVVSNGTFVID